MSPYFFIFGFGYTSQALAPKLTAQGFKIIGTSRAPNHLAADHAGVQLIDFDSPDIKNHLKLATHLLISVPPVHTLRDIVLIQYGDLIKTQAPSLKWLGYLSSTGVYGNHDGNWISEASACLPHTPTGITRLKAEQAWLSFAETHHLPLHIFRLSGIYGPRRNALERLLQGKAYSVFKPHQVFCRIHVEDIVAILLASIQSPEPLSIYNATDDEPAPAHVVDNYAANLLYRAPLPLVPFSEAKLSPMEQEFYANNRRVSNLKIKQALHVCLQYPTYKEGLTQIWENDFAQR